MNIQKRPVGSPYTVVVTDLDGTLLDHDTYSYVAALPALNQLESRGIPVVVCSSKTMAEIVPLRSEIGIEAPFIVENGAAIGGLEPRYGAGTQVFGCGIDHVRAFLQDCRQQYGFQFKGFGDMDVTEVIEATGLTLQQAILAKEREYSEPLIWQDSEQRKTQFLNLVLAAGLSAQQGGRFLTLSGQSSKGRAVSWLRRYYQEISHGPVLIIALGDSPNDESLLNAADIAVIISSAKSQTLKVTGARRLIRTEEPGPKGWCKAVLDIIGP